MSTDGPNILRPTKSLPFSVPEDGFYPYVHRQLQISSTFDSHIALVDLGSGKQLTFSEIAAQVVRVAYHLYRHGVRRGDVFALCAPNSATYVILILAVARLGAVFAVISALSSTDDLKYSLPLARAKYIFTDERHSAGVRSLSSTLLKAVFVEGASAASLFASIPSGERSPPIETVSSDDVCAILFSSGTSGLPKAVELTNKNFLCSSLTAFAAQLTGGNIRLVFQPLSHVMGLGQIPTSMTPESLLVIIPRFDLKLYLELVAKYKIKQMALVPPVMVQLAKSPLVAQYDLSSVEEIIVGAAPVSAKLEQLVKAKLGTHICIRQAYGMTECGVCTLTPPRGEQTHPAPTGSAGCTAFGTQLKFTDVTTGIALGPNTSGEIRVKSDQVMKGYAGNQLATREAIDENGWLRTGDVGYYDDNGYVFIVDRLKELIKYNAYQVAPAELEGLLLNHPDVADAGVIGLPDEKSGELPHAWVVHKPGSTVTEQEIVDFVAGKVASYKKLRGGVKFVSEIPKSPSGKILRRVMRSEMATPKATL